MSKSRKDKEDVRIRKVSQYRTRSEKKQAHQHPTQLIEEYEWEESERRWDWLVDEEAECCTLEWVKDRRLC